jgi:hypothetical protein
MYLVYEIRGVADAHEGTSRIDIILPSIQLFVVLEREVIPLVFRFKEKTVRLKIGSFDVRYVTKVDDTLLRCGLQSDKLAFRTPEIFGCGCHPGSMIAAEQGPCLISPKAVQRPCSPMPLVASGDGQGPCEINSVNSPRFYGSTGSAPSAPTI